MAKRRSTPSSARRILFEWLLGTVDTEIPHARLASALKSQQGDSWDSWLIRAARKLGWEAQKVRASSDAVGVEREAWWITGVSADRERWLVVTGERKDEARASLIDGHVAKDVPSTSEGIREALDLDEDQEVLWVRVCPRLPLENLRRRDTRRELHAFRRLKRWVRLERGTIWAVVAYSAIIGGISLALPLAVQSLVNSLALGRLLQPLLVLTFALFFLLGLAAALRVLEVYIVELLQRRMFSDLSRDLARRLPSAQDEAFGPWGPTERINRFFDVVGAQKAASFLLLTTTEILMSAAAGLTVLAFYHRYLLVFDLVLLASLGVVIFRMGANGIPTAVEESHAKYEVAAWLESIARQKKRFSSPEGTSWATRQADRLTVDWLSRRSDHFKIVLRQTIGFAAIQAIASAGLLGLGGFLVWNNQLTLGQLVASELIVTSVLAQLAKFGKHVESFYDLNASVEKIGQLLDLETEPVTGELLQDSEAGIEVQVNGGRFEEQNLDLTAEPGQVVGLSQLTHGTRRTLFGAIYGTHHGPEGTITLDGVPVTALAPRDRRHHICYIQGPALVGATLEENLSSQNGQTTSEELRDALDRVGLHQLIERLPQGLQTWITPEGDPLSRDEAVALEVARALLRHPRLILVDQALDGMELPLLRASWKALTDGRWTLLVASERDEVLDHCDRILRPSSGGAA